MNRIRSLLAPDQIAFLEEETTLARRDPLEGRPTGAGLTRAFDGFGAFRPRGPTTHAFSVLPEAWTRLGEEGVLRVVENHVRQTWTVEVYHPHGWRVSVDVSKAAYLSARSAPEFLSQVLASLQDEVKRAKRGVVSTISHVASRPGPSLADLLAMEVHGMELIESEHLPPGSVYLVDRRALHFQTPGTTQFILDPDPTRKR